MRLYKSASRKGQQDTAESQKRRRTPASERQRTTMGFRLRPGQKTNERLLEVLTGKGRFLMRNNAQAGGGRENSMSETDRLLLLQGKIACRLQPKGPINRNCSCRVPKVRIRH